MNFFLINLFVGVLCDQFIKTKYNYSPEKLYFLSEYQQKWLQYQQLLIKTRPLTQGLVSKNSFRILLYRIVNSSYFDGFLVFCILGNIVILALNYDGSSENYVSILEFINYLFTGVFLVEFLLKISAFGTSLYFQSNWNLFDLFIVISSIIEILLSNILKTSHSFLRIGPQIIRIFRVLRVTRIFKLIKKLKSLQKLIETLVLALPSILNLGLLYLLVFFIYAILGVFLFKDVNSGKVFDDYNNFQNIIYASVLLFRMVTGEGWWDFMFDCLNGTQNPSTVFLF